MVQCVLSHHTVLSRETEGNQKNRFTYVYNRIGLWFGSQNNVPAVDLTIMAATQDAGSMESLTSLSTSRPQGCPCTLPSWLTVGVAPTRLSLCTAFMAHSGRSAHKADPCALPSWLTAGVAPTRLSLCTAFMAHSGSSAHKAVPVHCLHGSQR